MSSIVDTPMPLRFAVIMRAVFCAFEQRTGMIRSLRVDAFFRGRVLARFLLVIDVVSTLFIHCSASPR